MAQVPYNPVPTVPQDERLPTEGPRIDTPGAAFGANIAEGVRRVGQAGEQVGNELFASAMQIQGLKNETDARNQSIATTQKMAERFAQYDSLGDQERSAALPGLLKDLNDLRLQGRAGLNPMAARMYDAEAANLQNSFTRYGALQAGRSVKDAALKTAQAGIDLEARQWVDPFSEGEYNGKVERVKTRLNTMASNLAWSQDQYDDALLKETSKLRTWQILTQKDRDPQKAYDTLDKAVADKEIDQQQYRTVKDQIDVANRISTGNAIADKVFAPSKPMDQAIAQAKDMADPLSHGDNQFWAHVQSAVKSRYTFDDSLIRRQNVDDIKLLDQAVGTDKFKTTAEMMAVPELKQAMERLAVNNPKQVMNWQGVLDNHWKVENKQTNDNNYHYLYEMAYKDPEKFLGETLSNYQLGDPQRRNLDSLRNSIIRDPNGDPRVTTAMRWMQASRRGDLQALNIFNRPGKDEDNPDWGAYIAALQGGIEAYQETHGKNPDRTEIVDVIGPQAIRQVGTPHWYGITRPEALPSDVKEDAKQELIERAKGYGQDIEPSEQEIQAEARRRQFIEFYSKGKSGGGSTTVKPTTTISQ